MKMENNKSKCLHSKLCCSWFLLANPAKYTDNASIFTYTLGPFPFWQSSCRAADSDSKWRWLKDLKEVWTKETFITIWKAAPAAPAASSVQRKQIENNSAVKINMLSSIVQHIFYVHKGRTWISWSRISMQIWANPTHCNEFERGTDVCSKSCNLKLYFILFNVIPNWIYGRVSSTLAAPIVSASAPYATPYSFISITLLGKKSWNEMNILVKVITLF